MNYINCDIVERSRLTDDAVGEKERSEIPPIPWPPILSYSYNLIRPIHPMAHKLSPHSPTFSLSLMIIAFSLHAPSSLPSLISLAGHRCGDLRPSLTTINGGGGSPDSPATNDGRADIASPSWWPRRRSNTEHHLFQVESSRWWRGESTVDMAVYWWRRAGRWGRVCMESGQRKRYRQRQREWG